MADEKRATENTNKMEELYEKTTKEDRMKIDQERAEKTKNRRKQKKIRM